MSLVYKDDKEIEDFFSLLLPINYFGVLGSQAMQSFHQCELKCVVMEGNLAQYRLETDFKSVSEAAYQVRTSQLSLPQKVMP